MRNRSMHQVSEATIETVYGALGASWMTLVQLTAAIKPWKSPVSLRQACRTLVDHGRVEQREVIAPCAGGAHKTPVMHLEYRRKQDA